MYTVKDIPDLVRSDRRLKSAGVFLLLCIFVWLATSPWRSGDEKKELTSYEKVKLEEIYEPMQNFNVELDQHKRDVAELHQEIKRSAEEIRVGREEFEWHTKGLMDRLSGMSNQLNDITNQIGGTNIQRSRNDKKIAASKRSSQKIR